MPSSGTASYHDMLIFTTYSATMTAVTNQYIIEMFNICNKTAIPSVFQKHHCIVAAYRISVKCTIQHNTI